MMLVEIVRLLRLVPPLVQGRQSAKTVIALIISSATSLCLVAGGADYYLSPVMIDLRRQSPDHHQNINKYKVQLKTII